ncbi:MAG: hypothetical protein IPP40_15250 [bacterium]|nr:hypothetical protein [bacterium]
MNKKLQYILLALGLSVILVAVGCSKEDDNNDPQGPTSEERLTGFWFSDTPTAVGDSVDLRFYSTGLFELNEYANFLVTDELFHSRYQGTWTADDNSVSFHVTTRDDSVTVDLNWDWAFELHGSSDDTLHLSHNYGAGQITEVTYVNVTPPASSN